MLTYFTYLPRKIKGNYIKPSLELKPRYTTLSYRIPSCLIYQTQVCKTLQTISNPTLN